MLQVLVCAWLKDACLLGHSIMSDSATPWTVAHQAPLSVGFSRQEYWSGLPFLSPGDLPDPGIEPLCTVLQVDSLPSEPAGSPGWRSVDYKSQSQLMGVRSKVPVIEDDLFSSDDDETENQSF